MYRKKTCVGLHIPIGFLLVWYFDVYVCIHMLWPYFIWHDSYEPGSVDHSKG